MTNVNRSFRFSGFHNFYVIDNELFLGIRKLFNRLIVLFRVLEKKSFYNNIYTE